MKGIYLAAYKALHPNYNLDYNDIKETSEHINIIDDMMNVDLSKYDYIIATPPCNYWSRANYRRETSEYSQKTKHLLPAIIDKLIELKKPFIIENVRSHLFLDHRLLNKNCFIYEIGRHTYWTNRMFNASMLRQLSDNIQNISSKDRQGGINVHNVIEYWLQNIVEEIK